MGQHEDALPGRHHLADFRVSRGDRSSVAGAKLSPEGVTALAQKQTDAWHKAWKREAKRKTGYSVEPMRVSSREEPGPESPSCPAAQHPWR